MIKHYTIKDIKKIIFPKISDHRGNISFLESNNHVPFDIKRVFFIYDIPSGQERGGHAHIELHQILIALSGSFDYKITDGKDEKIFHLSKPYEGIYIPPTLWGNLSNFSSGSVSMALASDFFKEKDYIREMKDFIEFKKNEN